MANDTQTAPQQTLSQADLQALTQVQKQLEASGDPRADKVAAFLQTYPIPDTNAQAADKLKSLVQPSSPMVPLQGRHRTSAYQPDTRTLAQQQSDQSTATNALDTMAVAMPALTSFGTMAPSRIPLALLGGGAGGYGGAKVGDSAGGFIGGKLGNEQSGRTAGTFLGGLIGTYLGGSAAEAIIPQVLSRIGVTTGQSWLGLKSAPRVAQEDLGNFMSQGYQNVTPSQQDIAQFMSQGYENVTPSQQDIGAFMNRGYQPADQAALDAATSSGQATLLPNRLPRRIGQNERIDMTRPWDWQAPPPAYETPAGPSGVPQPEIDYSTNQKLNARGERFGGPNRTPPGGRSGTGPANVSGSSGYRSGAQMVREETAQRSLMMKQGKGLVPGDSPVPTTSGSYWSFNEQDLANTVLKGDRDAATIFYRRFGYLPEGAQYLNDVGHVPNKGLYRSQNSTAGYRR
jgi:hypothetical protein